MRGSFFVYEKYHYIHKKREDCNTRIKSKRISVLSPVYGGILKLNPVSILRVKITGGITR